MGEILHKTISQTDTANQSAAIAAETLLVHYSFELSHATAQELVNQWLQSYPSRWLRLAIIEALYQGRYKSISVEQILLCWHRRSKPIYHFNLEFEQLICNQLPGLSLDELEGIKVNDPERTISPEKLPEPSLEEHPDSSSEVYPKNPQITPINTNSNSVNYQRPSRKNYHESSGETETQASQKKSSASLTDELEASQPVNTAIVAGDSSMDPCEVESENRPEKLSEQTSSHPPLTPLKKGGDQGINLLLERQIKSEIMTELLQDPWLDDSDQETLENVIDSEINNQMGFAQGKAEITASTSENHHSDSLGQFPGSPIHEFTPSIEESSEFYGRLKAIVENKLKQPEGSRPRGRHK